MSSGRLRFLLVTTFYPPFHFGGDALYVRQLAHVLAARGHSVDVVHSIDAYASLSSGALPAPIAEPERVRVIGLESSMPTLSCLITHQTGRPLWFRRQLQALFENQTYDVIHYHNISLIGGPDILRMGQAIKLYTAHEHWLVCPTHVLWRHNREPCESRQCLRCVANYRRPPQWWRSSALLDSCSANVHAFIALSEFSAQKHAEFGFLPPMRVMPSFIANSNISGSNSPGNDSETQLKAVDCVSEFINGQNKLDRPWFLFVGRLERIKGAQDAIDVFSRNIGADLCIVGDGDYADTLTRRADGSPHIKFLGSLSREQLIPLYRETMAVVLPSVCYEVFPMVALESFSLGVPVIARALGPFPEIVARSAGGILFHDQREFRQAVLQLIEQPETRDQMGASARRAFSETWSELAATTAYFSLLRELAASANRQQIERKLQYCTVDGRLSGSVK